MNENKLSGLMKKKLLANQEEQGSSTVDKMKESKCKSSDHILIWASISLLLLGQVFTFAYLCHFEKPLMNKSCADVIQSDSSDDDLVSLFDSLTDKSSVITDIQSIDIQSRKKRSSSEPKPKRKRSDKVI